jgi:hypothetical protein
MEKPSLQSKFFPAKFPLSKIQKKNLAGKIYFAKERGPNLVSKLPLKFEKFQSFENL